MADEGQSHEDKTEAATTRHLDQARERGQVPISFELGTLAALIAVGGALIFQAPAIISGLVPRLAVFLARAEDASLLSGGSAENLINRVASAIVPILAAGFLAAVGATLIQTQFLLHGGKLSPDFSRVNPARGLKRLFGFKGLIELAKSLAKIGVLASAIWMGLKHDLSRLLMLPASDPRGLLAELGRPVLHVLVAVMAGQTIIAAADLLWVRFQHGRDLRMSKQDVRDEMRETEGNPHVKARMRRIRMIRARNRMMAKVPTATVVITNPTHYAVALVYDRAINPAPKIVAKGTDAVAARIRELATANGVPLIPNPPLARALHRLELETEIPAEYYKAVAEIIAYLWRLQASTRPVT